MKKVFVLVFTLICLLGSVGCSLPNGDDTAPVSDTYIVIDTAESYLLVAKIGEDGKALESMQYSVSNVFYPNTEVAVGEKITIAHNGIFLESFPMQFDKIYSMTYHDSKTGLDVAVNID